MTTTKMMAPVTSGNFSSATQVAGEPTPQAAGATETMDVALAPGTYYFAIVTEDEAGNKSDISNVLATDIGPSIEKRIHLCSEH